MIAPQVLARLRATGRRLPEGDGLRWFNEVYVRVTEQVHELLDRGHFEDRAFLVRLDEVFADLYLDALQAEPASAWAPLLAARADPSVAPARFMLAGINAHVNYDLPIALVCTCREVGGGLATDTARHRDFQRVDDILADVEQDVHHRLQTTLLPELLALWAIIRARDRAWTAALQLARLPPQGAARRSFLHDLGSRVAACSELLLHGLSPR